MADLVGTLLIWSLKTDDWNHFSCSTILLLGSCALEYIHLLRNWTEYFRTTSLREAIVQKPTAYIQTAQPLQPSHSSFVQLCAPRMLSEDDPEDLQDGLEPWELPKKRLILVPLADREDCCGVGTFRS